jgi:beta-glucosidase
LTPAIAQSKHPNAQLDNPAIEARVDALLRRMTLEEKIGQLVQYGGWPPAPTSKQTDGAAVVNPEEEQPDSMKLAEQGLLGSVLNTWGPRADALQHAAVEKGRLHIPLLFGADVIHGYRTIMPILLAMASSFDPELITQVAHAAALEATTAGINWVYFPDGRYRPGRALGKSRGERGRRPLSGLGDRARLYSWLPGRGPLQPRERGGVGEALCGLWSG